MAAPLGSVRAMASGSGVRAGSVKNSSRGRAFPASSRGRKSAAVLAKLQKPSEMAVTPSASVSAAAYLDVVARIARAAQASGRTAADVTLVAVSKTQPWEAVAPVLAAGQTVFGENRVQEAMERWQGRTNGLTLHWSSGPVEGTVCKIKALKRAMYGRASFALLRHRILING